MPVRGLKRTKFRFGLAVGGLNFIKLQKFMKDKERTSKMQPCYSWSGANVCQRGEIML